MVLREGEVTKCSWNCVKQCVIRVKSVAINRHESRYGELTWLLRRNPS